MFLPFNKKSFIAILLLIGNLPCRHYQRELSVSWQLEEASEEAREYGHLLLPITISHTIDPASPLYTLGPAQLARAKSVIFQILLNETNGL